MSQAKRKFDYVMHEWKQGKLHSSSGELVKYPSGQKQALAIAYGKARDIDPNYGSKQKGGQVALGEKYKPGDYVFHRPYNDQTIKVPFIVAYWSNDAYYILGDGSHYVAEEKLQPATEKDFIYHYGEEVADSYKREFSKEMAKGGVVNMDKHIWEGWTVGDFIRELEIDFQYHPKFQSRDEVKEWAKYNQPYYKKYIPDVVNYYWAKNQEKYSSGGSMATGGQFYVEVHHKVYPDYGWKTYPKYDKKTGDYKVFTKREAEKFIEKLKQEDAENISLGLTEYRIVPVNEPTMATGGGVDKLQELELFVAQGKNRDIPKQKRIGESYPYKYYSGVYAVKTIAEAQELVKEEKDFIIFKIKYIDAHSKEVERDLPKYAIYIRNLVGSMATGGYSVYADGGIADERKKIRDKINVIKIALLSPETPEPIKEEMRESLAQLEKQLAEYKSPAPIQPKETEVEEVQEEIIPVPADEDEEESQVVTKVPSSKKSEEITNKVKAHIKGKIDGEFEGTIETSGGKPLKVKEKVSVEVKSEPEESESTQPSVSVIPKGQRNISVPSKRRYWVGIEKKYANKMRNAMGKNKIPYTARTLNKKYTIFVESQELLDKVLNIYNLKRAKGKDSPVSPTDVSGKYDKGGKVKSNKIVKNEESLRSKAIRMGLIKKGEKPTDNDLEKIEKQSPKWKKRVQLARRLGNKY